MARVLVVEDDAAIREMLQVALEESGHRPTVTADGQRAVELATALRPDVVVLDYRLPSLSGDQVAAQFASDPQLRSVPILLCTALSPKDIDLASLPSTVTPLFKPFELTEFLGLVDRLTGTGEAPSVPVTGAILT